jgi:class 3 adenylate cyclase
MKRKLAAVVHADVKGYSALMGRDEAGTVRLLRIYRDILKGLIELHGGRLVDTAGDGFLCEFPSAVNAVEFAVEFQQEIGIKNADLTESQRMEFRMGINVGDVIEEDEKMIYGDGVNIAARLEGLAEAGGICISGTVYDQIKNKMDLGFLSLGEQTVKNISHPVRAFRIRTGPALAGDTQDEATSEKAGKNYTGLYLSVGLVLVLAVAIALWFNYKTTGPKLHEPGGSPSSQGAGLSESNMDGAIPGGNASDNIKLAADLMFRDTKEDNLEARRLLEKEIELHPRSAKAIKMLAMTYIKEGRRGWGQHPDECMKRGRQLMRKATGLMRLQEGEAVPKQE